LGKSLHLNRPGKEQISDFSLLPVAVTQIKKALRNFSEITAKNSVVPA